MQSRLLWRLKVREFKLLTVTSMNLLVFQSFEKSSRDDCDFHLIRCLLCDCYQLLRDAQLLLSICDGHRDDNNQI